MARNQFEKSGSPMATPAQRRNRWIGPVMGAILGFLLGTAVITLAAAYLPEGTSAFSTLGLTLQVIGALLGLFIGGLLTRDPR